MYSNILLKGVLENSLAQIAWIQTEEKREGKVGDKRLYFLTIGNKIVKLDIIVIEKQGSSIKRKESKSRLKCLELNCKKSLVGVLFKPKSSQLENQSKFYNCMVRYIEKQQEKQMPQCQFVFLQQNSRNLCFC